MIDLLDPLAALRNIGAMSEVLSDLAADLAQEAYDAGATKKKIADALNVSPSVFRDMERKPAPQNGGAK